MEGVWGKDGERLVVAAGNEYVGFIWTKCALLGLEREEMKGLTSEIQTEYVLKGRSHILYII